MPLLEAIQLVKSIREQPVLRDISFTLEKGEKLAISGVTGSGKSSLLKIIAGLMQADSGEARFRGSRIRGPEEKLIAGHPSIAYLSQHFELRNNYRVEELVDMANQMSPEKAARIIDICRIGHLLSRRTDQLSGGEKQRIATARLLVGEPELFLLDEPYSNLDLAHRKVMKDVIRDISREEEITCVMVSHDPTDTLPWADRMLVLKNGQIVQEGSPETIYRAPADEYVAGLLGPYFLVPAAEAYGSGLLGSPSSEDHLIVRPEDFQITGPGEGAAATVQDIRFAGPHYHVLVRWHNADITLLSAGRPSLQTGETVYLRLRP